MASAYSQYTGTYNYQYNSFGQRIYKKSGSNITHFIYDLSSKLLSEGTDKQYIYLDGQIVGYIKSNQLYYVHTDHLGRPEVITKSNKSQVWRAGLKAFDRKLFFSGIGDFNIGFPGQYYDKESGLWYNINRYYDGKIGRYIQSDPIRFDGGLNTYAYVWGNPVNFFDPNGLQKCSFQQAKDFGLNMDNCWVGTDDITGKCVTAECAAGILPSRTMTKIEKCIAVCMGLGKAEGTALDKAINKQGDNYEGKVCKDQNANIKVNKVLLKAGAAGKIIGAATGVECARRCF